MPDSDSGVGFFLVEWYQSAPAACAPVDAAQVLTRAVQHSHSPPVTVILLLSVPDDETLFAVLRAPTVDDVILTCQRAGWPADRISADVQPWLVQNQP